MNIKEAKNEIKNTVKAYLAKDETGCYQISSVNQRPILLMGPPGIGKTQIMEQIARECQIGLVAYTITHHTRQSAVGLPYIQEETYDGHTYSITKYTMSEIIAGIYEEMHQSGCREGILFLDEINCVSETLAPTMLQFLQYKTFGGHKIPEGWMIVAAGNPPEYNYSVHDFDMVTLDRLRCMNLEPDFAVWKAYAKTVRIHSCITSYLELRPNNFYRAQNDVDGLQFVTARGWEDLSRLIQTYESLDIPVHEEVFHEFIHHEDVAQDIAAFYDLYHKYQDDYGITEILKGRIRPNVWMRMEQAAFDERLCVVSQLFDGLANILHCVAQEKERSDVWYLFLKDFRNKLNDKEEPAAVYLKLVTNFEEEFLKKKHGNLCKKEQLQNDKWLLMQLKNTLPEKKLNGQEAFAYEKKYFDRQLEKLEQAELEAASSIEYAFDFLEQAFTGGQEMVIFVTDLTLSSEAAAFLSQHPCKRFLKYTEQLLIGTRKEQLLSEIARDTEQFT